MRARTPWVARFGWLGGGGRYDSLLSRFQRPMPAVGFAFGLDRLDLLLQRQGAPVTPSRPAPVSVEGGTLGEQIARARQLRAEDTRLRLGSQGTASGSVSASQPPEPHADE